MLDVRVVTLFPEIIGAATGYGVCGRAIERGLVRVGACNPRDYAPDAHQTVDDRPYGGGPGMVLKYAPVSAAIEAAREALPAASPIVFLSPQGSRFDQSAARRLSRLPGLMLVAGRYEGFDERLVEEYADEELSLGDFVMSGGEIAAIAIIDALTRLLPGALGHQQSAAEDSFSDSLLDCPHYTRPEIIEGRRVPKVLLEGNHEEIRRWRLQQALGRTRERRPDLLKSRSLSETERQLLDEYGQ